MLDRIALGCGNFGGIGSAPAWFGKGDTEAAAFALMDAAWQLGIRRFDTADAYGGGASETWIGRWMKSRGVRPALTTKTFNPMHDGADGGLQPARIQRQIASSLERLGVASVELYLAHAYDDATPLGDTIGAFEDLVAAGTIGAYGVSNVDAAQLARVLAAGRPVAVQNSYSLLDRRDEAGVLPLCAQRGVAYQAFGPLAGGWLAGRYQRDRPHCRGSSAGSRASTPPFPSPRRSPADEPYPPGSRMTMRPEPYLHLDTPRVHAALAALTVLAAERGASLAGLALAWLLANPTVTTVVIGPRRPEHLAPVREALTLALGAEERARIATLVP